MKSIFTHKKAVKKYLTPLFFILAVIMIYSCGNTSSSKIKNASPFFTTLYTGNETAIFRNCSFGFKNEDVKKKEQAKLYESTADHLFYELSFPNDSSKFSEYANIQYYFNENNELDIITTDIFLSDTIQENRLRNTLIQYFTNRFGNQEEDDSNYSSWNATYEDKKEKKTIHYTIALKDLEDDFGVSIEYMKE